MTTLDETAVRLSSSTAGIQDPETLKPVPYACVTREIMFDEHFRFETGYHGRILLPPHGFVRRRGMDLRADEDVCPQLPTVVAFATYVRWALVPVIVPTTQITNNDKKT